MSGKNSPFPNVPAPPGSKAGTPYSRFIPREELGDFASWTPGNFGGGAPPAGTGSGGAMPGAMPGAAPGAAAAQDSGPDLDERLAQARALGYEEGYRDGLVALESFKHSFAQQATAQIGALLQAFDEQLAQLDAQLAQTLATTAVQLAQQVLRCELQVRPELVARVAQEAVEAVMLSARQIVVRVHPEDLPLVAEGADEVLAAREARLQADSQVGRGGVLVESDVGSIDARLATRWAQAAAALGHDEVALDDPERRPA